MIGARWWAESSTALQRCQYSVIMGLVRLCARVDPSSGTTGAPWSSWMCSEHACGRREIVDEGRYMVTWRKCTGRARRRAPCTERSSTWPRAGTNSPKSLLPALLHHSSHGRLQQQPEDVGPRQRARPERQDGTGHRCKQRVRCSSWRMLAPVQRARSACLLALSQARPGDGQAARREALHCHHGMVSSAGARVRWIAACGPRACGPRGARGRPVAAHTPGAPRRASLSTMWRRARGFALTP